MSSRQFVSSTRGSGGSQLTLRLASQAKGKTRETALENLDEAVALHRGEIGESVDTPAEEREILRDLGIDPEEVEQAREGTDELPEFMR